MSNSRNNHGLRTTGRPTGNFGRAKVQGKRDSLDLSGQILKKENLVIPSREQAFAKLQAAYDAATDPKIRATLGEMLRSRQATLRTTVAKTSVVTSPYWDEVKRVR